MRKIAWGREWLALLICLVHVLPFYILTTTSFKAYDDFSFQVDRAGLPVSGQFRQRLAGSGP
jgi:hypothetical protein